MSVLVIGSVALDTIYTPFGKAEETLGGSATYISVAASFFTESVRLVAVVGGDFSQSHIDFLVQHNVDIDGLQIVKDGLTFRWTGKYHYDLNTRDSLKTELNVFKNFNPIIPERFKNSAYVALGNIDPTLQLDVLKRLKKPRLVVGDTMNYWIENKPEELKKTLAYVHILIVNDSEARLLTNEPNLIKAAKLIMGLGPSAVIVKKGEHGALLVTDDTIFSAPAYPLETVYDPTGAGDTFAGGFLGWIAKTEDFSSENLKRAVVYGSTMASFCVEKFGVERLRELGFLDIRDRFREFMKLSHFDEGR